MQKACQCLEYRLGYHLFVPNHPSSEVHQIMLPQRLYEDLLIVVICYVELTVSLYLKS